MTFPFWQGIKGEGRPLHFQSLAQGTTEEVRTATLPTRAYEGDAGFDLYVSRTSELKASGFTDVHTDIAIELPPDTWGLIIGRSSTLRAKGLLIPPSVIDNGWRGELFSPVWNLTNKKVTVNRGERIAQLVILPLVDALVPVWGDLTESVRGTSGFGSTGR